MCYDSNYNKFILNFCLFRKTVKQTPGIGCKSVGNSFMNISPVKQPTPPRFIGNLNIF